MLSISGRGGRSGEEATANRGKDRPASRVIVGESGLNDTLVKAWHLSLPSQCDLGVGGEEEGRGNAGPREG